MSIPTELEVRAAVHKTTGLQPHTMDGIARVISTMDMQFFTERSTDQQMETIVTWYRNFKRCP